MKVLVLGATGMLGYQVYKTCLRRGIEVHAVVRNKQFLLDHTPFGFDFHIHQISDVKDIDGIENIIKVNRPEYVINCIGIVKQFALAENHYESIAINSFLPHQLEKLGNHYGFRLIHVSTDCIFDGKKGMYKESDISNASDLYGKSKYLGEVGYGCGITIRTSIIGHEITKDRHGLVDWFLSQEGEVNGYAKAFFSGLTTLELTNVILEYVIRLSIPAGIYQVSAERISKFDLITLIAEQYNKTIDIIPSGDFVIDRSLDSSFFKSKTGYSAPSWEKLIAEMKSDFEDGF